MYIHVVPKQGPDLWASYCCSKELLLFFRIAYPGCVDFRAACRQRWYLSPRYLDPCISYLLVVRQSPRYPHPCISGLLIVRLDPKAQGLQNMIATYTHTLDKTPERKASDQFGENYFRF